MDAKKANGTSNPQAEVEAIKGNALVAASSILAGAIALSSFMIGIGLGRPSEGMDTYAASALGDGIGENIGRGIAHAACINARGEWKYDTCQFERNDK